MKVGDLVRLNHNYDAQISIFDGDLRQGLGIIIKIGRPRWRPGHDYICYVRFSKINKIEKCYRTELELVREL